ncbi:Protein CBG22515 [Caenorhabditis briggsae]|uniref:Protein CBG22515 n=1 Tax=Caenorhabditis briggsae TaxID=6238 RepID=A8Y2G1_CAEBR|nr:Protein CBG22515 [Caenorhabditis briggsae]CAP39083.2 Protein CBG22515 [Caenorhabditis briggsae]
MGFPKGVQEARSRSGIEDTVRRFGAEADHGDSAILVFLTHGCVDGVYGTDGKVFQLNQVFVLLSPESSPQLALKPKLIFVESCRGSNRDAGYSVVEDPGEDQVLERSGVGSAGEKVGEKPKTIPMNPDFLISYSTSPGHVAFAHPRFGAYHVQLLCRTIAERAHQNDIETVMVAVRKGISQMEFRGEKGLLKQMPELTGNMVDDLEFRETELCYRKRRLLRMGKMEKGEKSAEDVGISESWEAEGLIQIEPEYAMNDFQMTAHSDSVINSTEPLFLEEPATSDEHPSTDEQEEKLMNELYGQLVFPEKINGESDVEDVDKSDKPFSPKKPSEQRDEPSDGVEPYGGIGHAKATASKVKSGSNLDEYELEALKKVGIKIRKTAKDQVLKDQDAVEGQKVLFNVRKTTFRFFWNCESMA